MSSQKAPAWRPVRHYSAKLSTQVCRYTNWLQFKIFPGCNLKSSLSFADPQAALAESNLSFLHRSQSSTSQSPMDRASAFQHHHHHLHDGSLALSGHQSASKRVKMETPDEELSSGSMKAPAAPSEEYYCRNPAGGSSLVVVKQQQHETDGGGNHSSGTDNEDNNDASSTENYEPLDFKAWRAQRSASNNTSTAAASNDDDEEEKDDGFANTIPGRASLTVEVGPASSTRLMDAGPGTAGSDYLTQTVRSAK